MPLRILISGGGTGGHVFPAIAIADAVRKIKPDTEFLFVGAVGKMEMDRVPAAGYKIKGLNITGIQRRISLSNLLFPFRLAGSLWTARTIIRQFNPNVVVGVGGFASGPVLRMATWMGLPTLIQEQNSFAGITNRWVSKAVSKVCVAYDGMDKFFPASVIVKTGNPVREDVVSIAGKKDMALNHFHLDTGKPVLLVVGGSLGARSINEAMLLGIEEILGRDLQVIWQTGKSFDKSLLRPSIAERQGLVITEFIREMDLAYAAADLVVSRAGAIAVSELSIVGKPVILVPFPHAAEDHQTMNALALVKNGAAVHLSDKDVSRELVTEIFELIDHPEKAKQLSIAIRTHAMPNAASEIAHLVISLCK